MTYIGIRVDDENNAEKWWDELRKAAPAIAQALTDDDCAVVTTEVYDQLSALAGFDDGPEYARHALIDCGSAGPMWADVVGGRHSVFDELR